MVRAASGDAKLTRGAGVITRRSLTGETRMAQSKRKSCQLCYSRKKKCDGDGVTPCSLCRRAGQTRCIFGKRAPYRSMISPLNRRQLMGGEGPLKKTPLKRFSVSPSPATGLLGTEENVLLSTYFQCMGFIQLATPSSVRHTMVHSVFAPSSHGGSELLDPKVDEGRSMETNRSSLQASLCVFWCAIGLGGLVQGRPIALVEQYTRRANDQLKECFDEETAEIARAYIALGYVHAYSSDTLSSEQYIQRGSGIVRVLRKRGQEHQDLDHILDYGAFVRHKDTANGLTNSPGGFGIETTTDKHSFLGPPYDPLQTGCIVSTDTVATFVLQVCQRLRRALAMADTSQAKPKTEKGCITHGTPRSFIDAGHVDLARQQDVDRSSGCPLSSLGLPSETYQQGSEDTPICFPVMQRHFKDVARPYEFLERNRDRLGIHSGFVAMMLASQIGLSKTLNGDIGGALEQAHQCLEVMKLYPGLCRISTGIHGAHCLASVWASAGCQLSYEQLRHTYNSVQPSHMPLIPSMEDWSQGNDVCDHYFCRSLRPLWAAFCTTEDGIGGGPGKGDPVVVIPLGETTTHRQIDADISSPGSTGNAADLSDLADTYPGDIASKQPPTPVDKSRPIGNSGKKLPECTDDSNPVLKIKVEDSGTVHFHRVRTVPTLDVGPPTGCDEESLSRPVRPGSLDRGGLFKVAKRGSEAYKQDTEDADVVSEDWLDVADTLLSIQPK